MANNLRQLREAVGWSQEVAAQAMGTTRSQYVKLEAGARRLSTAWIDRAAFAYGIDPAEVVRASSPTVVGFVGAEGSVMWDGVEPSSGRSEAGLQVTGQGLGLLLAGATLVFRHERRALQIDDHERTMVLCIPPTNVIVRHVVIAELGAGLIHCLAAVGKPLFNVRPLWVSPVLYSHFR